VSKDALPWLDGVRREFLLLLFIVLNILSPADGFRWGHSSALLRYFSLEAVGKIAVKGLIFPFRGFDKVVFSVEVDAYLFLLKPGISSLFTFVRRIGLIIEPVLVAGFPFKDAANTALYEFRPEPPRRSLSTESVLLLDSDTDWLRRGDCFFAMEAILSLDNLRKGNESVLFRTDALLSEIGEHSLSQFVRLVSTFLAISMAATSGEPISSLEE
jgi:hypothetical protein